MRMLLSDDWKTVRDNKRIIVYGLGKLSKLYLPKLSRDFSIKFIIDNGNDIENEYLGIPVYPFLEAKDRIENDKIVVVVGTSIAENLREEVKKYLCGNGLREYIDFCDIERFALEYYWRFEKRINIFQIHTAVTTNCTLKCRKCNMLVPYYKNSYEYVAEDIEENLDLLTKKVEFIFKYQLVGGEPFLNKDIKRILALIGEKYQNIIAWKRIVTNGTIMPDEETFNLLKLYGYDVVVSDYSEQVNYKERIDEFERKLDEKGITYERDRALKWVDTGLPETIGEEQGNNIIDHMKNCASSWHGLADKKLFYCNISWSAEKCGLFNNEEGDYIDLRDMESDEILEKMIALNLGDFPKGYNSLCRFCKGCGTDNNSFVIPGEQCR